MINSTQTRKPWVPTWHSVSVPSVPNNRTFIRNKRIWCKVCTSTTILKHVNTLSTLEDIWSWKTQYVTHDRFKFSFILTTNFPYVVANSILYDLPRVVYCYSADQKIPCLGKGSLGTVITEVCLYQKQLKPAHSMTLLVYNHINIILLHMIQASSITLPRAFTMKKIWMHFLFPHIQLQITSYSL